MKIALISAIDCAKEAETRHPPLGLASIAATLRARTGVRDILIGDPRSIDSMTSFAPDLVGISSVTQNYTMACRLAAEIKAAFNVPVLVGGAHISGLPASLGRSFVAGVIGEGEETMVELVIALRAGRLDRGTLKSIAGIVYWNGEGLEITAPRPLIRDLDSLPHPAKYLLRMGPTMHIVTSRGCPCRCAFCSSSRVWRRLRCHSAGYVVEEIRELVERYGVRRIDIMDDLFSANKERLREIAGAVNSAGLNRRVYFACHGRAEFVDEDVCRNLKKMGVQSITFGFESGSQRILSYLKKGAATVEKNFKAAKLCRRAGLRVGGSFIIGSPGETVDDVQKTCDFIRRSGISGGAVYVLLPYPGTEVWDYAKKKGLVDENMDWNKLQSDSFDPRRDIILTDEIGPEELHILYNKIRRELEKRVVATGRYLYAKEYGMASLLSVKKVLKAVREPGKAILFLKDLILYRLLSIPR